MLTSWVGFSLRRNPLVSNVHPYLVNNAGFVKGREHVGDINEADINDMFATNVLGLIRMTQLLVKREVPCIFLSAVLNSSLS
jgi:NAD(P)-dependent dehydrogenase (short-subunit alcohol dehydrogenase family)